jgi:hypothetical protein
MRCRLKLCLTSITTLILFSIGQAQDNRPSFSLSISAPQTVKARAPVPLDITVKNISGSRIHIDISGGMAFDFLFSARDSEGKKAPETLYYQAIQGKDPHTTIIPRIHIPHWLSPGETLKLNMDLTLLFDFKPGKYAIELSRPADSRPLPWAKPSGPFVASNAIDLTVTP